MAVSPTFKAAGFMALGMSAFTINDAISKALLEDISIGQVLLIRGIIVVGLLYLLMRFDGTKPTLAQAKNWPINLRAFFEASASIFFMLALAKMPIANVTAIMQALPLAVTLGAMVFLNEPVGWRRMSAIIAGFIGVMIIVRLGSDGFNIYAIFVIICVFLATGRDLATRKLDKNISTAFASIITSTVVAFTGVVMVLFAGAWPQMSLMNLFWLFAAACFLLCGYQFLIIALRTGDIGTVAPFRYTSLLWAVLLGYLIFGDLPDFWTIVGSVIVVASGLYALLREHRRNRQLINAGRAASLSPPARGT